MREIPYVRGTSVVALVWHKEVHTRKAGQLGSCTDTWLTVQPRGEPGQTCGGAHHVCRVMMRIMPAICALHASHVMKCIMSAM